MPPLGELAIVDVCLWELWEGRGGWIFKTEPGTRRKTRRKGPRLYGWRGVDVAEHAMVEIRTTRGVTGEEEA